MAKVVKYFIYIYAFIILEEFVQCDAQVENNTFKASEFDEFPITMDIVDLKPTLIWDKINFTKGSEPRYYFETDLGDNRWAPTECNMTSKGTKSKCSPFREEMDPSFCGFYRIKIDFTDDMEDCDSLNFHGICSKVFPPGDGKGLCLPSNSSFTAPSLVANSPRKNTISVAAQLPNDEILCAPFSTLINVSIAVAANGEKPKDSADETIPPFNHILQSKTVFKNNSYEDCESTVNSIAVEFGDLELGKNYIIFSTYLVKTYCCAGAMSKTGYVEIYLKADYQAIILIVSFSLLVIVVGIMAVLIQTGVIKWKKFWNFDKNVPPSLEAELEKLRSIPTVESTSEDGKIEKPDKYSPGTDARFITQENTGHFVKSNEEPAEENLSNLECLNSTLASAVQFSVCTPIYETECSSSSGNTGISSQPSGYIVRVDDYLPK